MVEFLGSPQNYVLETELNVAWKSTKGTYYFELIPHEYLYVDTIELGNDLL